ncbi:MAG: neutral/alkaline non-lysosomal ceramidase N-terminal domain-containing protein, partial [Acidobacteriota bacterium]
MGQEIASRVARLYRLPRANLVLSSSHTHSGPAPYRRLEGAYFLDEAQQGAVIRTTEETTQQIVRAVGEALHGLAPAQLSFGRTMATFGMNRRVLRNNRYDFGANRDGVKDDDVPLLRVTTMDGRLRAVLFSYACHNTTLPIQFYQFNGDYAGYAEAELEAANPGVTAMFMMGCGADIGPQPTGKLEMAVDHGRALARAIGPTPAAEMAPVRGRLRTRYELIPLPFNLLRREQLEAELLSKDRHRRAYAERWLRRWESQERVMTEYPYPLQVIQLGDAVTLVAMAGEVVVDYVLRLKRELGAEGLWVTAYCNDVMAYIPSVRILNEGGYEPEYSMLYYDLPGYWHPSLEEKIVGKVHQMTRAVGRRSQPRSGGAMTPR